MKSIKIRRDRNGVVIKSPHWISNKEAWLLLEEVYPGQYNLKDVKKINEDGTEYMVKRD